MSDARARPDDSIDVHMLARRDLPHEAFPGGRNEGFRVYFSPEVHPALWKHATDDTSVEICGVLVGSWHRDEVGPFAKIVESIRGEGAETRFAEVTFTHQTWAKINGEMDTKYAHLSIVGWYHTHPDFGIFLSDRDRFIHEHFFSGPGQVAHVIDPIRRIEGVFVWRDGKPTLSEHFWVGDRILTSTAGASDPTAEPAAGARPRVGRDGAAAMNAPAQGQGRESTAGTGGVFPPAARLVIYAGVFLLGYLLANILSAWEHQRFVESELASNGFVAVLRLGLADELDRLRGDLAAIARPLDTAGSKSDKADVALAEARAELQTAGQRVAAIKSRYGNTALEDDMLKRLLRDNLLRVAQSPAEDAQSRSEKKRDDGSRPAPALAAPSGGDSPTAVSAGKVPEASSGSATSKPD
jgi:proteasome lid subunit RPN8/RPN11